ncbi:MAG: hypothetical protein MZV63_02780 [Marinilabiliales bacterium]|nr:hypothetical protein [Marinilabiliales bacterium]
MKNYFRDEVFKGRVVAKDRHNQPVQNHLPVMSQPTAEEELAFTMFANGFTVPSRQDDRQHGKDREGDHPADY